MSLPELMSLVFRGSPASACKAADLQGRARPEFALGADQAGRPHERDDDRRDHAPIRRRPQGLNDPVRESASRKGESDIPDQSVAAVLHEGCGEPRGNEPCDKDREERSWGHDSSPFVGFRLLTGRRSCARSSWNPRSLSLMSGRAGSPRSRLDSQTISSYKLYNKYQIISHQTTQQSRLNRSSGSFPSVP